MAMSLYAWADSVDSYYLPGPKSESAFLSDGGLPSAGPTNVQEQQQPFTGSKNVSHRHPFDFPTSYQHRSPPAGMARKRHFSQQPTPAPVTLSNSACDWSHAHGFPMQDFACNTAAEHCHLSPPCDKPDCSESPTCYDQDVHDRLHCNLDPSVCQDQYKCDDVFQCEDHDCSLDFDCNFTACPDVCEEAECHQQEHAQHCNAGDIACHTVPCSDPQCNETNLYCCMSDICPHIVHNHCDALPPPDCQTSHIHCDTSLPSEWQASHAHCKTTLASDCHVSHTHRSGPLPYDCLQPCNTGVSCTIPSQDTMSASTVSTPHTNLSDSLQFSSNDPLQYLVNIAANQPFLNVPTANAWAEYTGLDDGFTRQHKRRKIDRMSNEQETYETKFLEQPFTKANQGYQDWQNHDFGFDSEFMLRDSRHVPATTSQPSSKRKAISPSSSSMPPEGLVCQWNDETTGPCDARLFDFKAFHEHVKEHTGALVNTRNTSRDYKCRWAGCEKNDAFGTKNHLDRHMQNHTGYKPFKCDYPGCNHRCITHQQLSNHKTTHTGHKPFVCPQAGCKKSFSVKTALSTHMRTHTNDKPFECKFCGDKYADSSNLSKHRKTVHEEARTSIPCPEAGCTYRDSRCQRLERHCKDNGHGTEVYSDAMKWAEYTGKWKKKSAAGSSAGRGGNGRRRTSSLAMSSGVGVVL